jgi:TELO2-interacting protein 1
VPPWFIHTVSQKLYLALAGMIRLVGLSTVSGAL